MLLVQRRVPSARRPSRANLKNISNRNAVASSQMRLGLLVRHDIRLKAGLPPYFADVLARELSTGHQRCRRRSRRIRARHPALNARKAIRSA